MKLPKTSNSEWRATYLIPVFLLATLFGFFLELIFVERLGVSDIPRVITHHVPQQLKMIRVWRLFEVEPLHSDNHQKSEASSSSVIDLNSATGPNTSLPHGETLSLLNLTNFRWLMNNVSKCRQGELYYADPLYVMPVLVHTARSHFEERLTIRKSWGSIPIYKNWSVRLVFLLGEADLGLDPSRSATQFEEQESRLKLEQSLFGDLVMGSFVDTYKNLTYKHMMGYKWILDFCPNATFVMKIDDDMFIDIMRFVDWRSDDFLQQRKNASLHPPDLYCNTFVGTKPQRCVGCKWYASEGEWAQDFYPDYCSGWAYGITISLIQKLYSATRKVPFFWVDDVYATGALMEQVKLDDKAFQLNVKHLWGQVRGLDFKNFRPMCEKNDLSVKRKFGAVVPIARGSNSHRDMVCLWNKTLYDSGKH